MLEVRCQIKGALESLRKLLELFNGFQFRAPGFTKSGFRACRG